MVCTTSRYLPSHNLLSSNNGIDKWKKLNFLKIIVLYVCWWQNIWINLPRHLQVLIVQLLNSFRFSQCPVSLAENTVILKTEKEITFFFHRLTRWKKKQFFFCKRKKKRSLSFVNISIYLIHFSSKIILMKEKEITFFFQHLNLSDSFFLALPL